MAELPIGGMPAAAVPPAQPPSPTGIRVSEELAARAMARTTRQYAADFAAAMESGSRAVEAKAEADAETAATAQGYAETFAQQMEFASQRTDRAIADTVQQREQTAQYAGDFAGAMEASSQRQEERIAEDPQDQLRIRIRELEKQKAADELERKAREAVEGPKESVAGTFSAWRLGGQFGTVEQTARQQLEETKRNRHLVERAVQLLDRIAEKQAVFG